MTMIERDAYLLLVAWNLLFKRIANLELNDTTNEYNYESKFKFY